jgi:hypothetical protein
MQNGTIERGQVKNSKGEFFPGEWKAQPLTVGQIAQVIVSAEINGKQQTFTPYDFRVKAIPKPNAAFANKTGGADITKAEILLQQAVFANLEGFDFDLRYTITEFRMSMVDRGFDVSKDSKNNRITDDQRALLNNLTRGKKLYIENIKAIGPDKKPQDLSPIIITVI